MTAIRNAKHLRGSGNSPATRAIEGAYRSDPVILYLDPASGLGIIATSGSDFVSGWRLGTEQLESVLSTARLFCQSEVGHMQIVNAAAERSQVELDRNELLIMNAALNEICHGIALFEFETRIGADRERVAALLKQVGSLLDKMDSSQE